MGKLRSTALGLVALAAAASSLAMLPGTNPTSAADDFCSLTGMDTRHWTGAGDGTTWDDAANWDGPVPGNSAASRDHVYVCLDDVIGGLVVMPAFAGLEARVQAVDIAPGTTVRLEEGSKLFVYGDQATRASVVRNGAALEVLGSTYGGPGRTDLAGQMTWRSLPPPAAATLVSAPCMVEVGEAVPPASCELGDPGLLVVTPSGRLDVDGESVNLFDRFGIEVEGVLRLSGTASIAADHGTRIEIVGPPGGGGVLDIRNDGGIYEGFTRHYSESGPDLPPATIRNAGRILKRGGAGTSAIDGTYVATPTGRVAVTQGTLTLSSGTDSPARVSSGRSYGSGTCPDFAPYGCDPVTTSEDVTTARFTVPRSDRNGATVTVDERGRRSSPDDIAPPVVAHADGLTTTRLRPAVLLLRYDWSVTGNRSWRRIGVFHQARPGAPFRRLTACDRRGRPLRGHLQACVDRRGRGSSSRNEHDAADPDGSRDAVMVVRTRITSRWVAR